MIRPWEHPIVATKFWKKLDDDALIDPGWDPIAERHHEIFGNKSLTQFLSNQTVYSVGTHQKVYCVNTPVRQQLPTRSPLAHIENPFPQEAGTFSHSTIQKQLVQNGSGVNANRFLQHYL